MKNKDISERFGMLLTIIVAVFWGMFPIIVNKGSQHIPPLFFAASSILTGAVTATLISLIRKDFKNVFNKKAFVFGCIVAFTLAFFPYGLLFMGTRLTSGVNTSALLLSEIIFTLIITPFLGEKPTLWKTLGGLFVLFGALIILFKGGTFNIGDLLIIAGTILCPIGNYYGKKALLLISGENLLIIRYFFGGIGLLILSLIVEDRSAMLPSLTQFWPYVALNGILLLGIINTIWYSALKRLQISKAIFLLMTYPVFSLLFLTLFYGERPNAFQILGILITHLTRKF